MFLNYSYQSLSLKKKKTILIININNNRINFDKKNSSHVTYFKIL